MAASKAAKTEAITPLAKSSYALRIIVPFYSPIVRLLSVAQGCLRMPAPRHSAVPRSPPRRRARVLLTRSSEKRSPEHLDGPRRVPRLQPMGRMRLDEMGAELAHVGVVVDDHVAGDGMPSEAGGDLVSPARSRQTGRGLVHHAGGDPRRVQQALDLVNGLAVPPGGRHHDVGSAVRHDLVQYTDTRGVQIPVAIPPVDRRQHTVDVEKARSSRHSPVHDLLLSA